MFCNFWVGNWQSFSISIIWHDFSTQLVLSFELLGNGAWYNVRFSDRLCLPKEDFVCLNETKSAELARWTASASALGCGGQFTGYLETHNFLTHFTTLETHKCMCYTSVCSLVYVRGRSVDFGDDGHSSTFLVSDSYLAPPTSQTHVLQWGRWFNAPLWPSTRSK